MSVIVLEAFVSLNFCLLPFALLPPVEDILPCCFEKCPARIEAPGVPVWIYINSSAKGHTHRRPSDLWTVAEQSLFIVDCVGTRETRTQPGLLEPWKLFAKVRGNLPLTPPLPPPSGSKSPCVTGFMSGAESTRLEYPAPGFWALNPFLMSKLGREDTNLRGVYPKGKIWRVWIQVFRRTSPEMSGEKQEQMRFSSNPGNGNNTESTQVLRDSAPLLGFVKNFNVRTRPVWLEILFC